MNNLEMDRLINYICQHDTYAFSRGAKLYAIERGVKRVGIGSQCVPYTAIVELAPTLKAVRIWLGY